MNLVNLFCFIRGSYRCCRGRSRGGGGLDLGRGRRQRRGRGRPRLGLGHAHTVVLRPLGHVQQELAARRDVEVGGHDRGVELHLEGEKECDCNAAEVYKKLKHSVARIVI